MTAADDGRQGGMEHGNAKMASENNMRWNLSLHLGRESSQSNTSTTATIIVAQCTMATWRRNWYH